MKEKSENEYKENKKTENKRKITDLLDVRKITKKLEEERKIKIRKY